jgi:ABC-type Fe3+ transport system permease subunit
LPFGLAVVAVAMWIGADRASLAAVEDWESLGGQGDQTLIPMITAIGIGLIVLGVLWLEVTRPTNVKAATHGLRDEWRISRVSLVEGIVAAILAVVFAVAFGAATIAAVGPNGAFFAVFSTLIGMAVGISVGLGLVRWIRGGKDTETTPDVPPPNRPKVELSKVERKR